MSEHGRRFDAAQRSYDAQEHPMYYEDDSECDLCIFYKFGSCQSEGETNPDGDCPSFKD